MKKVQGKKKRDAETAEATRKAIEAASGETEASLPPTDPSDSGAGDLLSSKDEDVIF